MKVNIFPVILTKECYRANVITLIVTPHTLYMVMFDGKDKFIIDMIEIYSE